MELHFECDKQSQFSCQIRGIWRNLDSKSPLVPLQEQALQALVTDCANTTH